MDNHWDNKVNQQPLKYVEDFTLKHLLLFEICACEICEKFGYKDSGTI